MRRYVSESKSYLARFGRIMLAGAIVLGLVVHWAYWSWLSPIRYEFYRDVVRTQFGTAWGMLALLAMWSIVTWVSGELAWKASLRAISVQVEARRKNLIWVGMLVGMLTWLMGLHTIASTITGRGIW